MTYYVVESIKVEPPPPEAEPPGADALVKKRIKDEHALAVKRIEKRNADLRHAVDEFVSVVIDTRTGHEVCVCEGPAHASYIAGLLNDRPPR